MGDEGGSGLLGSEGGGGEGGMGGTDTDAEKISNLLIKSLGKTLLEPFTTANSSAKLHIHGERC